MISKKETFEILSLIKEFFEHFEISQTKIDSWHLILKDSEYESVKENLLQYCKENKFAPKVADLLGKPKLLDRMNAIPGVDETREYLKSFERNEGLSDEEKHLIEESKAKIRQILRIDNHG